MQIIILGVVIILLVLILITILKSVIIVTTGTRVVVEKLGEYNRDLGPGINFLIPFVEYARAKISTKQQILDIPPQSVITKDNVRISVDNIVFYQVVEVRDAVYNIENYLSAIAYSTITNMRNILGNMSLDEVLSGRDFINSQLLTVIDQITDAYGIKVLSVEIKNILPPEEIQQAMEKQMRAERDKRATILEAEGVRQSQIARAEGEKQSKILQAQASKEAQLLEAEGKALAITQIADAEARAITTVTDALAQSNGNPAFIALKQVDALKEMAAQPSNKLILPNEAISSLGSLAAAVEVLKDR